ncbi:uncharacterized protein LOC26536282 [Drosophila yakuba]|uniref:Uncharacterized protein n=1 Tax=Drosophila yakuba TaxID=7245 RepID=A0A0R1DSD2_DROYA|nr:uncharacterized protein LOC26536282 [Drosophila yakuba]KRJ97969.1 uncharacterized protein Dyak_GE29101 [Drosophila yakuba]
MDCSGDFNCGGMRLICARRFHSCPGFSLDSGLLDIPVPSSQFQVPSCHSFTTHFETGGDVPAQKRHGLLSTKSGPDIKHCKKDCTVISALRGYRASAPVSDSIVGSAESLRTNERKTSSGISSSSSSSSRISISQNPTPHSCLPLRGQRTLPRNSSGVASCKTEPETKASASARATERENQPVDGLAARSNRK